MDIYQVAVYKVNDPDDFSTWELKEWQHGEAAMDANEAAKMIAKEFSPSKVEKLSPPRNGPDAFYFYQSAPKLAYTVERLHAKSYLGELSDSGPGLQGQVFTPQQGRLTSEEKHYGVPRTYGTKA
jgi:hypothetical protein